MIIFRYLSREVLLSTTAVTAVLLLIITSARLIKYLTDAATGKLDADFVLLVLAYRIPGFLELLLPLGLFLGILLGFGRLYLESEMVVLRACGVSHKRLVLYALGPALLVSLLVAAISLVISPWGVGQAKQIFAQQEARSELELLTPGRFQSQDKGARVTYAQRLNTDNGTLEQVFIAQQNEKGQPLLLFAKGAEQRIVEGQGRFLVLEDGYRFDGVPGRADYSATYFGEYGVKLPEAEAGLAINEIEAKPTAEILHDNSPRARAQMHWRLSLPVLAFIVTLIAVPLSRTNPRQGRFAKLIPSIIIYLLYVTLLTATRSAIEDGKTGAWSLWAIHLGFLMLAANLIFADRFWESLFNKLPALRLPGRLRKVKEGGA
ncbi:putative permease [Marinobacterium lacunae]|uniref:Lipopolysaccharide export system permease protein LptF n=1 Tax=Marinobacterium lacunae TaxID=1232683 RepID=A0A081G218_9GAMM|nr:LPS export ABC transporter permease LptF [Marinobacterium lacunae]KEA64823.1 putative permease [Marinobacterium lacunae]MBR9883228.1 LPS export ABC transporter permease LptF [Oceanospirillales bacterium]